MEQQSTGADGEVPAGLGLMAAEYEQLRWTVKAHHRYAVGAGQCSSVLAQRIHAPLSAVWAIIRRFDCSQEYKHSSAAARSARTLKPATPSAPGRLHEL
ncbi:abscisic acid receptor PYR1-like [Panicum miliaceum]|uniref:Abscisic acid receptor PYR1-like n=1 Tax=Panicum miliaceum TaxID=4540 RepID=A0A3L6QU56_PANMI|nr:abscisic acid receptor PYR1-like [Panicum miliaceum]